MREKVVEERQEGARWERTMQEGCSYHEGLSMDQKRIGEWQWW